MARLRVPLLLGIGVVFAALFCLMYATDALRSVDLDTVDARFSVRGTEKPPKDLILVKIDDVTFEDLGKPWPFSRKTHADVIDRIAADHPRAIVYDVQFTEQQPGDISLATAILNADGKVVLATTEVGAHGATKILNGDEVLKAIHAHPANGLLPLDPGGVLRRVAYSIDGLRSLAVVGSQVGTRRLADPKDFRDGGTTWIDFRGPPGTIPSVSFSRVVKHKVPKGFFH